MTTKQEILVPDIGDFSDVEIIEMLIKTGDEVALEQPLITLESDKATMEVPSSTAGIINEINVKVGDRVSQGDRIAFVDAVDASSPTSKTVKSTVEDSVSEADNIESDAPTKSHAENTPASTHSPPPSLPPPVERSGIALPHASPSIRRLARELGTDLSQVRGSGPKGRILETDLKQWIRTQLRQKPEQTGGTIPPMPEIDFTQFGEIEIEHLSRIKSISGPHLHRAWLNVPLVTHHDEADITDLEDFRRSLKTEAEAQGIRITLLTFAIKALVNALKRFPHFNASLAPDQQSLILKKYYNIGIAIDTPQGLVVPSIKQADVKSAFELASELGEVSQRARDGKLRPDDLKGGTISISSLGGIGGTAFTPLVNAPEVAILGLTRARTKPVWNGEEFTPQLMLPIDLSYDHRVIDGAQAARFVAYLCQLFSNVRRLSL